MCLEEVSTWGVPDFSMSHVFLVSEVFFDRHHYHDVLPFLSLRAMGSTDHGFNP